MHHFGAVIRTADRRMVHGYRLANSTRHDIKVVGLINRKPCCGELRTAGKTTLHPGDETEIEVTLSVRREFGEIVHEAVVLTDPPPDEELVLRTMATAYPALRVEQNDSADGAILLSSDQPRRVEFRVFAHGTIHKPPVDLDDVQLRSTIKVDWSGPKEVPSSEDELRIESRRFVAWLDPAGAPGSRRDEVVLQLNNTPLHSQVVNWEAASPLEASPRLLVMKTGKRDYEVRIKSRDERRFRITRVESPTAGIRGKVDDAASDLSQNIVIQVVAPTSPHRGALTVFSDHPGQEKLDVPFIVLD